MSGPNQHHIPQFLQRPFANKRKGGQPNDIWLYTRNTKPELRAISKTASEDHFYGSDLDAKLKVPENALGRQFSALRKQAVGTTVDPALAADLVAHLAPRSKHVRTAMAAGFHHLAAGAHTLFTDPENFGAILGLDAPAPNEQFRDHLAKAMENNAQIKEIRLPLPILERVAFYMAKEQFDISVGSTVDALESIFHTWLIEAPTMARDGHNRALQSMSDGKNPRRGHLVSLSWTVEAAPAEGAILPDCVALGYSADYAPLPMIFVGREVQSVTMPISTDKLLVGRSLDCPLPNLINFNRDAAACSEEFFLAYADRASFRLLGEMIGTCTVEYFEDTIRTAASEVLPTRSAWKQQAPDTSIISEPQPLIDNSFSYDIRCLDFGDDALSKRFADVISPLVARLSNVLPMSRLDGITIAIDYRAAVRALDRGSLDLPSIEVEGSGDVGIVGTTIVVVRNERTKGRVILSVLAADYLLREDDAAIGLALQILTHQLVLVAMIDLIERAVPNAFLTSVIEDPFQAVLFSQISDALNGFVAARISGGFGDDEKLAAFYRASLCDAMNRMKRVGDEERTTFPEHLDAERLGAALVPTTGRALYYAALLLGHCEATEEPIADQQGLLVAILQDLGLDYWLADFGKELEAFWERLGQWNSLADFLAFNRHVERLLWAVGVFPWLSPEGERVEVLQLPRSSS